MEESTTHHSKKVTVGVIVHDLIARRQLRGVGWRHLRTKTLKIYNQNIINCQNLGGKVLFKFKNPYKLHVPFQKRTLCTLRFFVVLCCLLPMNRSYWEDLVVSLAFAKLFELNQKFILEKMLVPSPTETVSTGVDVSSKGVAPEVVSMEALAPVPTTSRSPRSNPTHSRET